MKVKYFILSAIFLFNPLVSVIDILPDFLGYYFLMKAFTPTSYIFDNASDLYDSIKRMMTIGVIKFFCTFLIFVTDTTMALVLSFSFAIVELIYGITMLVKLFDVTSYIRLRYDNNASTKTAERMKRFSIFFLIAKLVLGFIPDLTALTIGNSSFKVDLTRFRPVLFLMSAIVALVLGIIWFIRYTKFFKNAFSDQLIERVDGEYNEQKALRPGLFMAKDYIFAIKLMSVGALFIFDMSIDSLNIFLDAIFSFLCILAFHSLIKKGYVIQGKEEKRFFTVASVHIFLNIINFIASVIYFNRCDMYYVYRELEEFLKYLPIGVITVAESVLLLVEIVWMLRLLQKYTVPNIWEYKRYFAERSVDGFVDEYKEKSHGFSKTAFIWAAITIVYFVFYTFIRPLNENFALGNYLTSIVFIIIFKRALSYTSDRVYLTVYKYS